MRSRGVRAVVASLVLALGAEPAAAQSATTWILGGGLSLPAGEFKAYANTGMALTGAVERSLGAHPTSLRFGVSYAVNTDNTAIGFHETTRLTALFGSIVYHFIGARPRLYALLGAGLLRRDFSSTDPLDNGIRDSHFAIQIGEGVTIPVGSVRLFAEARFISTLGPGPFQLFPVVVGIRLGGR